MMNDSAKKPYFKNLSKYGDLYIAEELFSFDGMPISFVCKNKDYERFFVHCTDSVNCYAWLVVKIEETSYWKLLNDKISVSDYINNCDEIILVEYNGKYRYKTFHKGKVPVVELPDEDLYLNYKTEKSDKAAYDSKRNGFIYHYKDRKR